MSTIIIKSPSSPPLTKRHIKFSSIFFITFCCYQKLIPVLIIFSPVTTRLPQKHWTVQDRDSNAQASNLAQGQMLESPISFRSMAAKLEPTSNCQDGKFGFEARSIYLDRKQPITRLKNHYYLWRCRLLWSADARTPGKPPCQARSWWPGPKRRTSHWACKSEIRKHSLKQCWHKRITFSRLNINLNLLYWSYAGFDQSNRPKKSRDIFWPMRCLKFRCSVEFFYKIWSKSKRLWAL